MNRTEAVARALKVCAPPTWPSQSRKRSCRGKPGDGGRPVYGPCNARRWSYMDRGDRDRLKILVTTCRSAT
jgi:hypothetical protein